MQGSGFRVEGWKVGGCLEGVHVESLDLFESDRFGFVGGWFS